MTNKYKGMQINEKPLENNVDVDNVRILQN